MARRKSRRFSVKRQEREKRQLKRLREMGLAPKVDLRRKPGKKEKNILAKFGDVLIGKAKVVDVGTRRKANRYKDFARQGSLVVVPKRVKGERIRANKDGEILTTRRVRGKLVRGIIAPRDPENLKAPKGKRISIAIPFQTPGGIVYQRFASWGDAEQFMMGYERYKNWKDYTIAEFVDEEK